ncbi:MAG: class I SAM-dependent methyltransferase [Caulobacteraceae bacterium]|nr:class I SAM-dependent methyltransferase [Caulobacter sp.]
MSAVAAVIGAFEGAPLPDAVRRSAVRLLVANASRSMQGAPALDAAFAAEMARRPIAEHAEAANEQHYEVPTAFFQHVLGPRMKYSCCRYPTGREALAQAEEIALAETCAHADLRDGQRILELGCGWGSLSLWMAERYPDAEITSVSNSATQRAFIEAAAQAKGLANLRVVTADMNAFAPDRPGFDRIVSVEMFEHMANWRALLTRARSWLKPEGALFLHVFSHRSTPYRFDREDPADWIAQHFFTGGVMPSHALIRQFADLFAVDEAWTWSGVDYRRTADQWLENFDVHAGEIMPILRETYGMDAKLWARRWRLFFMATAGLFGYADGAEWGVSHYRLRPVNS